LLPATVGRSQRVTNSFAAPAWRLYFAWSHNIVW